jgi:predicted MPP superfamily phosphohydrolase
MRKLLKALLILLLIVAGFYFYARAEARFDPVVRTATIKLPRWPAGIKPVRAVLISDIHIGSQAMDEARLSRIVDQINALHPDIVLIAGDFIYGADPHGAKQKGQALVAPLKKLHPPLGVVAVLGNHDHWTGPDDVTSLLAQARITTLVNDVTARGPIAIGGVDDDYTKHADIAATMAKLRPFEGARIILTHSPDIAPRLPGDVHLLLAGHTHCGQGVLPFYGPVASVSRFKDRYRCGLVRDPGLAVIVTGGLGTSGPPLRFGAPPDLWLITLEG